MGQLKVKRLREWSNRHFSYKILVNGQEQFEIANGQERILMVEDTATLQAKLLWCGSKRVAIPVTGDHAIQEVRIRAKSGPNIQFPLLAMTLFVAGSLITLVYPNNEIKGVIISVLIGVLGYALALITLGRNTFLDIEVVRS